MIESLISFLLLLCLPLSAAFVLDFLWIYHLLHLISIYYFLKAAMAPPGSPYQTVDGSIRNCHLCSCPKPERTHHCSTCSKCILKMDHHCIWLNNCIGFYNNGHFTRFLLFVSIISAWTLVRIMFNLVTNPSHTLKHIIIQSVNLVILVPFTSIILMMTWNHLVNILRNRTTIEALDEALVNNVFDLGIKENVNETLGHHIFGWILPLDPKGNGLHYKKNIKTWWTSEINKYPENSIYLWSEKMSGSSR